MRAMSLQCPAPIEQSPLRAVDIPLPEPGKGEARLKVHACGVCRTDLHIVEGDLKLPRLPIVPGHQIVGRVDSIGDGVDASLIGRRAGVAWVSATCGSCAFCRSGRTNLCTCASFTGLDLNGGYAERVVVPAASIYPLDEEGSDAAIAPLLCAGIIGYRALKVAEADRVRRVGLYGFGGSAHIALQIARHWGCEVFVATRSAEHQRQALALGASWAGDASDVEPGSLEAAVLFAPSGGLVPTILKALGRGGILSIAGIHLSTIPRLDYRDLYWERQIRSVANNTRTDGEQCLALGAEIPIRTQFQTFALDEANEALEAMKHSKLEAAAAVLIF